MQVRLYATLRALAGAARVEVPAEPGEPVGEVLRRLVAQCPALGDQILTPDGAELLPHVQVFIAGRSIRDLQGMATPVPPGVDLAVFPPVAGGCGLLHLLW
ncbi:MAG: MoaD/ThiS family protein [Symbiobacteriaceae bacterium]|uniref:MoaD/ThiS family protein n=1 Tax=Symbiobacterium thermophilum TaxID=2734 RepID=A0A1Y2T432_SYMTR|nr:MAG: hypothetical protein A6D92_16685 [Symbiobacterium thermophilum]PZN72419.1 MAG: molybdopterin synthase sulfur carrier subunit [Bacillota bacterium]